MTSQTLYSCLEGKQIVKLKHAVIVDGINVTIIGKLKNFFMQRGKIGFFETLVKKIFDNKMTTIVLMRGT